MGGRRSTIDVVLTEDLLEEFIALRKVGLLGF
jgi:hypothetical protein